MMRLEDLPTIEGGSVKQQMFAESVRLNFISFVETNFPDLVADAQNVLVLRTNYKWWIDRVKKIESRSVKTMITAGRTAVKKHGSLEAARQAVLTAEQNNRDYFQNRKILGGILDERG